MKKQVWASLALSVLLSLALVAGCGMKGPPLPPLKEGNILAAPDNLAYTRSKDTITLSWTHAVDPVNAKIEPEAFKVFLATKSSEQCEGCPFIFEEAGVVPMPGMQFQFTLKQGLNHYFRVQAIGDNNRVSKFSQTLYIEAEAE